MIAMMLGLFLVAAAVQVFLASKSTYRYNHNLATLQDNARFALHALRRDIRQAGYTPCAQRPQVHGMVRRGTNTAGATGGLLPRAVSSPNAVLPRRAVAASDAIRIGYMRDDGVRATTTEDGRVVLSANPAGWGSHYAPDVLLVTDCQHADLIAVGGRDTGSACAVHHLAVGLCSALNKGTPSFVYAGNTHVLQPHEVGYYIGRTHRTNASGTPVLSLYQRETYPSLSQSSELAPNITHLVVRYGVGSSRRDRSVAAYVPAARVTDWRKIRAVQIGFVAVSRQRAGVKSSGDLSVLGRVISVPDDGHIRHVFTTTIALRNRPGD